ncbi:hypothetical protein Clacol_001787 [Clathrus columnatus]|uniref:Peroxisome assembly protein 12 n=1 Tax=Clathrus columnatus TaxID=1419009 RepID=A0AAV5A4A2_9AGAM|nr:hypothetical protein Clacol_001787 [Clathrus columnatus]
MEFFNDVGEDPKRPSLFELVAQEQLRDLLQPALKYVLAVFAQRNPRYLLRIVNRHEEFYSIIMFIVERHYLKTRDASFAENFYGLKRRRKQFIPTERADLAVNSLLPENKLRSKDIWQSLLFLIGIPYLRAKAQDYYESLGGGVDEDILRNTSLNSSSDHSSRKEKLRRLYKRVYPILNFIYEIWLLYWNIGYLFDKTSFYRPWLSWLGLELRRLGPEDMKPLASINKRESRRGQLTLGISSVPRFFLNSLRILLPSAIFFIKFLEWWYSPSSPARILARPKTGPAIPPPKMLQPHPQGVPMENLQYGQCPICRNYIANATALPSGYFGKQIQAEQIPGWSQYYLDYKALKKIVSSLSKSRPVSEAASLVTPSITGIRPANILGSNSTQLVSAPQNPLWPSSELSNTSALSSNHAALLPLQALTSDDDRGSDFQAYKAAFFFKLERELEKINNFYLQKEAELKLRLETLLTKRKAAASRFLPEGLDEALSAKDHVEWKAVEEGFRLLERDLAKLQHFVEINATGFRKILKKWDKRSKSTTKELYLARQVDVQPVFNRQLLAVLSNTVTDCLMDITNVSIEPTPFQGSAPTDIIFSHQVALERTVHLSAFNDLESNLQKAVSLEDEEGVRDLIRHAANLVSQDGAPTLINRILWKAAIEAPPLLADIIMSSSHTPFDFHFIDDINGRTCLHEASIAGTLRLVELCLSKNVQVGRTDVYGRTALHYAAMYGHAEECKLLLGSGVTPDGGDMDNYTPLVHAIISGNVKCVQVLLDDPRVKVMPNDEKSDISPLSLACQHGRVDIVLLLTQHGVRSTPNSNGEYPIHLAAGAGHADVCKLLLSHEGLDVNDKYNEWTPLFHAAANGHEACLKVLLDAGCKAYKRDETGRLAVFYAAWYGYWECVRILLTAIIRSPGITDVGSTITPASISPLSDLELGQEADGDHIPSLSLPPPIIPFRVYGHNYLDKTILVQVTLGHAFTEDSPDSSALSAVQLMPRTVGRSNTDRFQGLPSLKLVITSLSDKLSAHHTVTLPVKDKCSIQVFPFQLQHISDLSLEFSIYPSFGSKTLGRGVVLAASFRDLQSRSAFVVPVLDNRLHVIGRISFEVSIITPFHDVTLEIGGSVETYWKSTIAPQKIKPMVELRLGNRLIGSGNTSPSIQSPSFGVSSGGVMVSSLRGVYVHATVQLTRDMIPVVFSRQVVSINDIVTAGISDLTLAQIISLVKGHYTVYDPSRKPNSSAEWISLVNTGFILLFDALTVLPKELGLHLELVYPTKSLRARQSLGPGHGVNDFVDSVLSTVYKALGDIKNTGERETQRRNLVFSSLKPDICSALNWKQPNYAVFFATDCGIWKLLPEHGLVCDGNVEREDRRCQSVAAAVDFAKWNNLLGILINGSILAKVPSLTQTIKDSGLLLGAIDSTSHVNQSDIGILDAVSRFGTLTFADHTLRL